MTQNDIYDRKRAEYVLSTAYTAINLTKYAGLLIGVSAVVGEESHDWVQASIGAFCFTLGAVCDRMITNRNLTMELKTLEARLKTEPTPKR